VAYPLGTLAIAFSIAAVTGLGWRKSSKSIANGQCLEAASLGYGRIAVRDSVNKSGPIVTFDGREWLEFIKGVKDGRFDAM
jgi:hypothetical protein